MERRNFIKVLAAVPFFGAALARKTEKDFVAYTIPNHGRIPERYIKGDYVMVPIQKLHDDDHNKKEMV